MRCDRDATHIEMSLLYGYKLVPIHITYYIEVYDKGTFIITRYHILGSGYFKIIDKGTQVEVTAVPMQNKQSSSSRAAQQRGRYGMVCVASHLVPIHLGDVVLSTTAWG